MSWEEARARNQRRLEGAAKLLTMALALAGRTRSMLPDAVDDGLSKVEAHLKRQLERLRDNRFEVAVIGLEKAGKSALLNGWLGMEILPSFDERCTYTATEIWSAPTPEKARCEVIYYAPDEFEKLEKAKREARADPKTHGRDKEQIGAELGEIEQHRPEIGRCLERKRETLPLGDEADIRGMLEQRITSKSKGQALAIKRIQVFTNRLIGDENIVFHDVPGFDSPVEMHQKQARDRLAEADAIIYAKRLDSPDLVDAEIQMLRYADKEDPNIKLGDKLFVAFTRIDVSATPRDFSEKLQTSKGKWLGYKVPEARLVPVSPVAHLYRRNVGRPSAREIWAKADQRLQELGIDDGMALLRSEFQRYIDSDRARVVDERCQRIVSRVRDLAAKLADCLRSNFPDRLEDFEYAREDFEEQRFSRFWRSCWDDERTGLPVQFNKWYDEVIRPKVPGGIPALFDGFHEKYCSCIDNMMVNVSHENDLDYFDAAVKTHGQMPTMQAQVFAAHPDIRSELTRQAFLEINRVAEKMAPDLQDVIGKICEKAKELLFGLDGVREELIKDEGQLLTLIEHGMKTLFIRFARPAVILFLAVPRAEREVVFDSHRNDLRTLGLFQDGNTNCDRDLETYVRFGVWSLATLMASQAANPAVAAGANILKMVMSRDIAQPGSTDTPARPTAELDIGRELKNVQAVKPKTIEAMRNEILQDCKALGDVLKQNVFRASDFIGYCQLETERYRDMFRTKEVKDEQWRRLVRQQWRRGNPAIPGAAEGNDFEFRRGIVADLDELQNSLAKQIATLDRESPEMVTDTRQRVV